MTDRYEVFRRQRLNAARRRITWSLTFDQWWSIWSASGQWQYQGRAPDGYVLCRIDPDLGFELGNVQICTGRAAAQHYWRSSARPRALAHNRELGERRTRAIRTPMGDFESSHEAAKAIGISYSAVHWRIRHWPDRYYYR